jgi:hypothetical protein
MVRFQKNLTNISLNGLIGSSTRANTVKSILSSTVGGLSLPDYFALDNSMAPVFSQEDEMKQLLKVF